SLAALFGEASGRVAKFLGFSGENAAERAEIWAADDETAEIARRLDELFFAAADNLTTATTTESAAKIALNQRGAWRAFFVAIVRAAFRRDGGSALAALENAAARRGFGERLTKPFRVVLTGVPNAGKSSLLNAILGFDRAIVSPFSGTTRDVVTSPRKLGGWSFRFADAAGLRDAADPIERAGTRLAVSAAARADVVLRVFDATVEKSAQTAVFERFFGEERVFASGESGVKIIDVLNKIDLPRENWAQCWRDSAAAPAGEALLPVSAQTGLGVDALLDAIVARTVPEVEKVKNEPLPWTDGQIEFLTDVAERLRGGDFDAVARILLPGLTLN
ncbi:MAG: GTP-binding protein, partial [Thermoguttaceae bacterium]|nr:GTP-binding protein [Thermoguttaceae bacterium]